MYDIPHMDHQGPFRTFFQNIDTWDLHVGPDFGPETMVHNLYLFLKVHTGNLDKF